MSPLKLFNPGVMFNLFKKKKAGDFKFSDPENTACFTCRHVLNNERPVLYVAHDHDGSWQFLCGGEHTTDDASVVSLKNITGLDPSVNDLFEMPLGVGAERNSIDSKWEPFKLLEE
jgi:hypothetical protein